MKNEADGSAPNPTKVFYDRISTAYDLIADSSEHAARERGLALLAVNAGANVLVIGFGTGHSLVTLARAVGPTGRISGVDISQGMLSVAQTRIAAEGVADRVGLSLGDARELTYAAGEFDAAFIAFTLELFDAEEIPRVLTQIRRVLHPGGHLGVVAMSEGPHETIMTDIYVWMHRHFPHWVDCRPISVASCLEQVGFVVERLERLSVWGLPVAAVVARNP